MYTGIVSRNMYSFKEYVQFREYVKFLGVYSFNVYMYSFKEYVQILVIYVQFQGICTVSRKKYSFNLHMFSFKVHM